MCTVKFAITSFFLFFASTVLATTPSVLNVSGTTEKGETVTITGSNFGSHADYDENTEDAYLCVIWDDFETGTHDPDWDTDWGDPAYQYLDIITGEMNRANSTYVARSVRGGDKYSNFSIYSDNYATKYVYMSCWRYFYDLSTTNYTNDKIFRVYPSSGDSDWVCVIAWDGDGYGANASRFLWIVENTTMSTLGVSLNSSCEKSWHFYEILLDINAETLKMYQDGYLVADSSGEDFGALDAHRIIFDTYSQESSDTAYTYSDDLYISHTQARVMIGDASTFENSHHREMQIPLDWSSTSIQIQFNPGSFAENAEAYLYVINSDGEVNSSGYAITIGDVGVFSDSDQNDFTTMDPTFLEENFENISAGKAMPWIPLLLLNE